MENYNNLHLFFEKIEKIVKEKKLKERIDVIKEVFNKEVDLQEIMIRENFITFLSEDISIVITINDNLVNYFIRITEENEEIIEKGDYIFQNETIKTILYKSRKIKNESIINSRIIKTTSTFDLNLVEKCRDKIEDYQNYMIIDGKKVYIENSESSLANSVHITKEIRTEGNRLIKISDSAYYNKDMSFNNKRSYYKGCGISNNSNYLPMVNEYYEITEEEYKNFINGTITEEELFRNFVFSKK